MKQTKLVKTVRFLWLVAAIVFVAAIITNLLNIQMCTVLYISGAAIFLISSILAMVAASKDKEHLKNIELSKNDERIKNINILSKAKVFDTCAHVFPMIVSFLTILWSLGKIKYDLASAILVALCFLTPMLLRPYYHSKFSKEI